MNRKTVEVTFSHAGDNGEPYYRTRPSSQLLVVVDGTWHTATDDDCWQEADHPIDMNKYAINVVDDETDWLAEEQSRPRMFEEGAV